MIISRTPLRMSLVGGGTDIPAFYRKHGGAVVSTTINKYVYVAVHKEFENRIRIAYSKVEHPKNVEAIKHPLVRECLKLVGIEGGIEIMSMSDIPATGSGLGSSSSFTVGLLNALWAYCNQIPFPNDNELARAACQVEIELCGEPIGKQDQYAAAFGGLNYMTFNKDDSVCVEPIECASETLRTLERRTLLFYTGITRQSWTVLREQEAAITADHAKTKRKTLERMVQIAIDTNTILRHHNLSRYGDLLHENWELKKSLGWNVSSHFIDKWYDAARKAGALGGKLLGAGNGGFLMFYALEEHHEAIKKALPLRRIDFKFEPQGSRIVQIQ